MTMMSTDGVVAPAVPKPVESQQAPAAVQPPVDVAALTKSITESVIASTTKVAQEQATKIAAARLKEVGQALTGVEAPDKEQQMLRTLVDKPLSTLHSLKEVVKQEMRQETAQQKAIESTQRAVLNPIIAEHPGLNTPNKLALVESLTAKNQAAGMSYQASLEKAAKDTVAEFQLPSVSEAERNEAAQGTGLPSGGGNRGGTPRWDAGKSDSSFMQGMKDRFKSFRSKK